MLEDMEIEEKVKIKINLLINSFTLRGEISLTNEVSMGPIRW